MLCIALPHLPESTKLAKHAFINDVIDQGQGGAQSIEDGMAMGILFSHATTATNPKDVVTSRLALFESLRRHRCSAMQILSNAGQDEAERVRGAAARFIPIEDIPSKLKKLSEIVRWIYTCIAPLHCAFVAAISRSLWLN